MKIVTLLKGVFWWEEILKDEHEKNAAEKC
jgi:hypothetical protein